jgi:hypothetical protein
MGALVIDSIIFMHPRVVCNRSALQYSEGRDKRHALETQFLMACDPKNADKKEQKRGSTDPE